MSDLQASRAGRSVERMAFAHFLRTGRRIELAALAEAVAEAEFKYNHNHDPRNGRFTFAPGSLGGSSGLGHGVPKVRHSRSTPRAALVGVPRIAPDSITSMGGSNPVRPDVLAPRNAQARVPPRARSRPGRGHNGGPPMEAEGFPHDPMLIEQVVPTFANAPGGLIIGLADDAFDFMGGARAAPAELTEIHTRNLIRQIQEIDPSYRFQSVGVPSTIAGQNNQLRSLRLDRAMAYYRVRNDDGPLKLEVLGFLRRRVDARYGEALVLLQSGRISPRLNVNEALGNYVDLNVRNDLRHFYGRLGIFTGPGQHIQVNRRARNRAEGTFTVPDSRIGDIAIDVSLTAKTLSTVQVQRFFGSDFQPRAVVILRPSQLGPNSSYIITRPKGR